MKKIKLFLKEHWFGVYVFSIILLASFLRFYDYGNRWGLAYDQAHDAIVARYALYHFKLPLLGPFSSAGAFVTGPQWYWFIMLGTLLFPWAILTPWVVLTIVFVLFVYLMMKIGQEVEGNMMAIIVGLFSAVSTAQISQSVNLTNQAPLSILSAIVLWSAIMNLKTKKNIYIFLLGLSTGLAINTHLQGMLLVPFSLVFFILNYKSVKTLAIWAVGFLIPFAPLIYFDVTHNFYNSKNMLQYYLVDQYKISLDVLGRRWLTYLGVLWPRLVSDVIGGNIVIGYVISIISFAVLMYAFIKKSIPKFMLLTIASFLIAVVFIRYTRTLIFESYIMFMHPWIFLIVGWVILFISKKSMVLGLTLLAIVSLGSLQKNMPQIVNSKNYTASLADIWSKELVRKYPNNKFAVYDHKYITKEKSLSLVLYLDRLKKIDDNGIKIGLTISTPGAKFVFPPIIGKKGEYQVFNLNSSNSSQLSNEGWFLLNPSQIYNSTEEWYIGKKL